MLAGQAARDDGHYRHRHRAHRQSIEVSSLSALHTVAELKQEVAAATGGDVARLQLVYKNAPLEDGSTLESCGVGEGSVVNAVARGA